MQFLSAQAYQVTDSFGKHKLNKPPERVVVTDWAILEQLIELGIEPIGAPELSLYKYYVKQPALPAKIDDIGLRRSPNLKRIQQLNPDVIIVGTDQKSLARPFSHIAPVMYYNNFSEKYRTNGKKTRERFLQIAELFQRREYAQQKLANIDIEMAEIKEQIRKHFKGNPPTLTLIRFSSASKCLIYGKNSIPLYTMQQLGLQPTMPSQRSKWGEKEVPISHLTNHKNGYLIYIEPIQEQHHIFSSIAWQKLPAVREGRVRAMSASWSYGGAASTVYTARALRNTLLTISL